MIHASFSTKTEPFLGSCFSSICKSMHQLKQIHLQTIIRGLSLDPFVCFKLIAFCSNHELGSVEYARQLFDTVPEPRTSIWNTMIKGYSRINRAGYAVSMYIEMLRRNVKPDNYTYPFLLKDFTQDIASKIGSGIHCHICRHGFDSNVSVHIALIHMYSLCGQIADARGVFDMGAKTDVITWNSIISGYNKRKLFVESRKLFDEMEKKRVVPSFVTLISVLSACSKLKDLDGSRRVHQHIKDGRVEPNLVLNNALMDTYAACGAMDAALTVFKKMEARDVISWTTIVTGFLNSRNVDLARNYFDQMPERDSVSWTAMIDGYVRENRFKEALMLFKNMFDEKAEPDEFTMVSILTACANTGALDLGEWIHVYIEKNKINNDVYVGNALLDMYFKCGYVEKAMEVFKKMPWRDKFTWTAVIVGFAINGYGKEAIDMFNQMLKASIKPDKICYIGVLCACMHTGMVDEGRKFFANMTIQHEIEPEVEHYGCMVDLLGRAGLLSEAYNFIDTMPIEPNSVVWRALLGACGLQKNVEMAEIVAKKLVELEPENGAVYVLLCNIYAASNRWEDLREVRTTMMNRGITKTPGCSSIEINGTIHEFVARDQSHLQCEEIYSKLEMITQNLRDAGYSPCNDKMFLDIGE